MPGKKETEISIDPNIIVFTIQYTLYANIPNTL